MQKSILQLGKALNKVDQKKVMGGNPLLAGHQCIVQSSDPRCCTLSECGPTGGDWRPNSSLYGSSTNCLCY